MTRSRRSIELSGALCGCVSAWLLLGCGDDGSGRNVTETGTPSSTTAADTTGTGGSSEGPSSQTEGTSSSPTVTGPSSSDPSTVTETTTGSEGTDTGLPGCGNGMPDPGEQCDDGNEIDGDGCNDDCVVSGSILWTHTHASAAGTDYGRGVGVDASGDAYVAGSVANAVPAEDLWFRQYTSPGGLGWTTAVDGPAAGTDRGHAIVVQDEAIYMVGGIANGGTTGVDVWVRRTDLEGNPAWTQTFSSALVDGNGFPTPGNDWGHGIGIGADGNPVVGGWQATNNGTGLNAWLGKLDAGGAALWDATHNGDANGDDRILSVAVDSTLAVLAAGWEQTMAGGRNLWLRKYDAEGNPVWTLSRDDAEMLDDEGHGVAVGPDDTIVVVGREGSSLSSGRWFVGKYDADGNELWVHTDEGSTGEGALACGVDVGPDGEIVVAGHETVDGINQTLIRKYLPDGTQAWTTVVEGAGGGAIGLAVAIHDDGSIYTVGGRNMGVDGMDAWIAKLAP